MPLLSRLILVAFATLMLLHFPVAAQVLAPRLQPFVDKRSLAGAVVLVADKDKVLTAEAVGWADVAAKQPLKTDALFWVASQSKPIAATARRRKTPSRKPRSTPSHPRNKASCNYSHASP